MDHIDKFLATSALDEKQEPAIQAALSIGKKLLNKYYDMTDHSELYHIAMGAFYIVIYPLVLISFLVLHPSHKLEYFRSVGWDAEWVQAAEGIFRDEFERAYIEVEGNNSDNDRTVCYHDSRSSIPFH